MVTPGALVKEGHHEQGVGFRFPSTRPTWLLNEDQRETVQALRVGILALAEQQATEMV